MFLSPLSKTNLADSFLGPLFCTICKPISFYVNTKVFFFFLITVAIYCNLRLGIVTLSTLFSFVMITSIFCGILWFHINSGNRNFDRYCHSVYNFISIDTSTILILPICGHGISSVSSLFFSI